MSDQPNRCANCPRTGCSLFSPAAGQPATLCGSCAFPALYAERREQQRRDADTALCAELARTRRALAAAEQEVRELRRKLRNAHDANAALHDYTGGRAA